jgi:5-carboxymethyl-2-hydroxymuconate isomerase
MKYATLLHSSNKIPISNIFCVGQNYADHAKEMGGNVSAVPTIFLKPTSAIIGNGEQIIIPPISNNVHHEVELTVLIGKEGRNISEEDALLYVAGYGLGLDMTMRDLQAEAKKSGSPWTTAKGFATSAPLTPFVEAKKISDPQNLELFLCVNGKERQHGYTSKMIFPVKKLVSYLSTIFGLQEGDIIYTGTPEGVAHVVDGDIIEAEIPGIGSLRNIVSKQ